MERMIEIATAHPHIMFYVVMCCVIIYSGLTIYKLVKKIRKNKKS